MSTYLELKPPVVKGLTVRRTRLGQPRLREQPAVGAAVAVHGTHLVPGGGHAGVSNCILHRI